MSLVHAKHIRLLCANCSNVWRRLTVRTLMNILMVIRRHLTRKKRFDNRKKKSTQFGFWFLILTIELTIFTLLRAYREGNFSLNGEALAEIVPYFFANNYANYARWLPIHLRDMIFPWEATPRGCQWIQCWQFCRSQVRQGFLFTSNRPSPRAE